MQRVHGDGVRVGERSPPPPPPYIMLSPVYTYNILYIYTREYIICVHRVYVQLRYNCVRVARRQIFRTCCQRTAAATTTAVATVVGVQRGLYSNNSDNNARGRAY